MAVAPLRVQHRHSNVAGAVPTALLPFEVAVNTADHKVFVGDPLGVPFDLLGPAAFGALYTAWLNTLPTIYPGTAGIMWNNGGIPQRS